MQNIINGMKQSDDEGAQLSSLTELCELLSISTEESLTTFPVEQVVPLLVSMHSSTSHDLVLQFFSPQIQSRVILLTCQETCTCWQGLCCLPLLAAFAPTPIIVC